MITRQKRGDLQRDKKTLADLRICCKMKPILDLIQIRPLNYLASVARLPDDRLDEKWFLGSITTQMESGIPLLQRWSKTLKKQDIMFSKEQAH